MLFIVDGGAGAQWTALETNEAVVAIGRLLSAHFDGQHVVLLDRAICKTVEASHRFSDAQKAAAKHIRNRYADLGSLVDRLQVHARVVSDGHEPVRVGSTWLIPISWLAQFPLAETRCVGEDLNDVAAFRGAAQDHCDSNALSAFRLRLHAVHGGGNRTHAVLTHEATIAKHICICIVDSDRKYPGGPLGPTAEACLAVSGLGWYVVEVTRGRSIENAIPWRLIDKLRPNLQTPASIELLALRNHEPQSHLHIDLKRGVKGVDLHADGAPELLAYWRSIATAAQARLCTHSCNNPGGCSCKLHFGYGHTLLADLAHWLRSNTSPKRFAGYLPSPNDEEWRSIGALVAAYALGQAPRRI